LWGFFIGVGQEIPYVFSPWVVYWSNKEMSNEEIKKLEDTILERIKAFTHADSNGQWNREGIETLSNALLNIAKVRGIRNKENK